ncbi:MAG TPA: hypothetical protein DCL43_07340 [Chitinophagaceae bacterium]|nr:hypothetical protein [Chitinophagaceae bacterium]HAN40198.1 hypothetical protein [Chitinophagaceae bacterium]
MNDNLFDAFVKEKLQTHKAAVPADMWERIAAAKEPNRRPIFIWWLAAGLLFASLGTIAYWQWNSNSLTANENAVVTTNPLGTQHQRSNTNYIADLNASKKVTATNQELATTTTAPTIGTNNSDEVMSLQSSKLVTRTQQNNFLDKTNNPSHQSNNTSLNTSFTVRKHTYKKQPSLAISNLSNASININDNSAAANFDATTYNSTIVWQRQYQDVADLKKTLDAGSMIGLDCPSANGRIPKTWYIEAYTSADMAFRNLRSANSAYEGYISKRDSMESSTLSYTTGVRGVIGLSNQLFLKTGLQYSQINERFTQRIENERKLTTVITIRTVVHTPGDTLRVSDTSSFETVGYITKRGNNQYRSFDIPILLSYEWGNDSWKFGVTGGAVINVYSWYKGNMLDSTLLPLLPTATHTGNLYKHNIGIGAYASMSIIKPISNTLSAFAEPYLRYNFGNISGNKAFTQRFHVAGVQLGIRYQINNH